MPTVPSLPPDKLGSAGPQGLPTDPSNFLLAAADLHQQGQLSAPTGPTTPVPQSGKPIATRARARSGGRDKLQLVK